MTARPARPDVLLVTSSPAVHHPRHYHLMAAALQRAGLEVLAMGQPDRSGAADGDVPVRLLPRRGGRAARMLSGPATMVRVWRQRPALVHVTCLDLLPWAVALRVVGRTRVLYDSNEDYASYMLLKAWVPRGVRPALSRVVGAIEPFLAGRLDAVTVADAGTAEVFAGIRPPVVVVHNYPWLDFAIQERRAEPEFDIVYHGSLPPERVDIVARTARALADRGAEARWCLAARDYTDAEQRALEQRLTDAGVRDAFDLRYNVPFAEMPGLLANARVGYIPLPDEPKYHKNLPRKIFEYFATGMTCVASDLPPIRRLVGEEECCVLVPPDESDRAADALASLLHDPVRADRLGARGRELVLERWNAERELEPYVELCRALTAQASPGTAREALA